MTDPHHSDVSSSGSNNTLTKVARWANLSNSVATPALVRPSGAAAAGSRAGANESVPSKFLIDISAARFIGLVLLAAAVSLALALYADFTVADSRNFGKKRTLLALAVLFFGGSGVGFMLPAAGQLPAGLVRWLAVRLDALLRFAIVAAQVAGIVLVMRWFRIESPVFHGSIALLVLGGFVIHHALPMRLRLPFFALLSMAGIVTVFGSSGGAWLIGLGLGLIAICHLPIAFAARVTLLVAAGAVLAALRGQFLPSTVPQAIWPILASMFMFRLILYVYDLKHSKEPAGAARTLSYFFLLPNVAFPLFPVIDFATFRRTYYDRDALQIYHAGVRWMLVGLTHLLAYRVVYQYLTIPAGEVSNGLELARYMTATFLLYLKVSGQFHLIVGILHLFGFRLPESHRFFYLASSFTDFWRRINIYWKDFMTKVFYYPVFFQLRRRGETFALVVSTLLVFFVTWALHSYQWYWLLGSVLLSWPDALFWGILAVLLVANSLREARYGRKRQLGRTLPPVRESIRHGFAVAGTVATICILWSLWSSHTVGAWFNLWGAARIGVAQIVIAAVAFTSAALLVAAGHQAVARLQRPGNTAVRRSGQVPSLAFNALWLLALMVLGSPVVSARTSASVQEFARDLRVDKLNRADADLLHRGYYENLTGVNQFNSRLWEAYAKQPSDWQKIWNTEAMRNTDDFRKWEVAPLVGILFNGTTLRTNRWGMRDQNYELTRPADTYRIVLTGASFAMGQGVNDHESFEQLVEERLNAGLENAPDRYEILNFGVPNYSPIQQLLLLESKGFDFNPQAIFVIGHPYDTHLSNTHIARMFSSGIAMPYAYLDSVIVAAGLSREMTFDEMTRRLLPYRNDIVRWSLKEIVASSWRRGVHPVWVFVTTPEVPTPPADIRMLIEAASDAGFTMIDVSDAYGTVSDEELRLAPWDAHPNARAHGLIADRLYRALVDEGMLDRIRTAPAGTSTGG